MLLDDKVYDQVDWLVLGGLLQRGKMDFEARKSILFEERLFSKLNELAIVNAITCKELTSQQRFELINDERISQQLSVVVVEFMAQALMIFYNHLISQLLIKLE